RVLHCKRLHQSAARAAAGGRHALRLNSARQRRAGEVSSWRGSILTGGGRAAAGAVSAGGKGQGEVAGAGSGGGWPGAGGLVRGGRGRGGGGGATGSGRREGGVGRAVPWGGWTV